MSRSLAASLVLLPAALFADAFWDGGGGASLWSEAANWSDDTLPSSGNVWIGNGQTSKVPEVDAGTASAPSTLYVGHSRYAWAGPGSLTVSGGTLQVGGGIAVGVDWRNGAVTQTGGQVNAGELALGHESNFGSYTISGGALNAGGHLLLTDAGTSSGLFEVNGSGATSITASFQLGFRNGTGELKFVLDAAGVTPITAARLILRTGAGRILTVDASAYTGPPADIVLVDYSATGYWDGNPFTSINLSANATNVSFGGVLSNRLTVHVVPVALTPTTTALVRSSGTGTTSTFGDPLSFDVTVSGAPGPPTGNVTLKDGGPSGAPLGTGTLSSGACTITTNVLAVGTHDNIVAIYGGDSTYATSTSSALTGTQTVNPTVTTVTWDGGGTTNLWSESANWSDDILPSAFTGTVRIGDNGGTITKMPEVAAGTAIAANSCYVGDNGSGPGSLTVSGGTLQVNGGGLYVGTNFRNGAVTQTGGQVTVAGETALGHETNFGSYTISGGALNAGAHLLLTDAGTSSGLFEVNGSGATSITASYQLRFRNGTGELKYVLDAAGVTPITAARLYLGTTGAGRILTVDASAYTGPEADIVLVDYSATGYWDGNPFTTVNLSGGATSISFGGAIANKLTVHVVPVVLTPTTTALVRSSGTGTTSIFGGPLSFDVTVSGAPGPPTGNVTLRDGGPSGAPLGTGTLSDGACTITTNVLAVGTHNNIVAIYDGDSTYATSTSSALTGTQTVIPTVTTVTWDGGGTTNLWSEAANWSDDILPSAFTGTVRIGDNGGTITKMPEVAAGTAIAANSCYVGDNGSGNGPGTLTVSGGTLHVNGAGLYVGYNFRNGAVTQTGGQVTLANEMALGHETNFGSYRITGGSLNAVAHLLLTDAGTSSGLLEVDGTDPTSIAAGYQVLFRNGAGELKYVMDASGVTPITTPRLNFNNSTTHKLTVDASAYTGPEDDLILMDNAGGSLSFSGQFGSLNLSGGAQSIAYGTVIPNALTVYVIPSYLTLTTTTVARSAGTGTTSTYGTPLSFDVTVSGDPGPPTGTVTLKDGGPGGTTLGTGTLSGGTCTIITTTLAVGTHDNIVAVYGRGNGTFASSTSSPLAGTQTVNIANTYTTWAAANGVTGGPNGDSDGDGIPNLVEYALNLNPAGSDGSPGTLIGSLLSFTKRAEAVTNSDVTYMIEESTDLGLTDPWTEVLSYQTNDGTTISCLLPDGVPANYARLKVTTP
ncbi:MAG: Ig-like domain-containing protein [Verrucomicrobia bacterium]|nr:Ig-like domain-containing protein [Verrucomicrobiota bacterium]